MGTFKDSPDDSELRRRAEEKLKAATSGSEDLSGVSPDKMANLIHELQVHQIELKMQNDELRRIQVELEKTRDRYSHLYDFAPFGYFTMSEKGIIEEANLTGAATIGIERSALIGKPFTRLVLRDDQDIFYKLRQGLLETEASQVCELRLVKKDGHEFHARLECMVIKTKGDDFRQIRAAVIDMTERKRAEDAHRKGFEESQKRQKEISASMEGVKAVLEEHDFKGAAQTLFDSCKNLIGATGGYVALLSKDGTENEVLFLDSGGLPCTVDPNLRMPIRGLREEAFRTGKPAFHNDFPNSDHVRFMPEGHLSLSNVLFAPLMIRGKAVGLLGLANKSGEFTEDDAHIASAFSEITAIALVNKRMGEEREQLLKDLEQRVQERTADLVTTNKQLRKQVEQRKQAEKALRKTEESYRTMIETMNQGLGIVDESGLWTYVNEKFCKMVGYAYDQLIGRPVHEQLDEMNRMIFKGQMIKRRKGEYEPYEMALNRKDGSTVDMLVSPKPIFDEADQFQGSFAVFSDITKQKKNEESFRKGISEIRILKDRLESENVHFRRESKMRHEFDHIIGHSNAFKYVLYRAEQVALTNTIVLILGETGKGAEQENAGNFNRAFLLRI